MGYITLLVSLLFISQSTWADNQQAYIDQTKPVIKSFATALQTELKTAIKAGGPVAGIEVCNTKAPVITKNSQANGWEVSRTSLKWRNPNNVPDQWEQDQMRIFDKKMKAGADPKTLWAVYEDEKQIRVIKAIPTQPVCLTCHGSELAPSLKAKLNTLYPDDKATGFGIGDLRGAFSLKRYKF